VSTPYPLHGLLITGPELDEWLRRAITESRQEVWICSAYVRTAAFQRLLESRAADNSLHASVLVRWQPQDLISGASDLELFPVCRERGISLYLKLDFHGKVYAVPPAGISVGSTNATASGLGFGPSPNSEMNTLVMCTEENLQCVKSQFIGATAVTDQLYARMRLELDGMRNCNLLSPQWSSDVMSLLQPPVPPASLLVDECFLTDGCWWSQGLDVARDPAAEHDLQLLGVGTSGISLTELQLAVRSTKCIRWLTEQLKRAPQRELYFGTLTAALHDALLDDPGPRRSEVKTLLQNLLSWVQLAGLSELNVDRPNYSQRVRLSMDTP
jgi:hypothetical protein